MTNAKSRLLLLAVGLLTAGPASAATLTVYAKMSGSNAVGKVAPASGTTTINCFTNSPANCVDAAATGAIVLEATSESNATFVSWVGCASVAGAQCTLDLTTSKTVTANFKAATQALTVKTYPAAPAPFGGKVTAATTPAIDCGREMVGDVEATVTACSTSAGTSVELTAVPLPGSKVTSWSGCTSSTATTCTVSMTSAKVVSATFGSLYVPVTAQVGGNGTVSATVDGVAVMDGMDCGTDCTAGVTSGSPITLIARPSGGGGPKVVWVGCDTVVPYAAAKTYPVPVPEVLDSCTINSVTAAKTVAVAFKPGNCSACHNSPPTSHGTAVRQDCATCHTGYTATTVVATTHMNGAVESANCKSCHHGSAAKRHGLGETAATLNGAVCMECHPFDQHRDGNYDVRVGLPAAPTAGFGFNISIEAATATTIDVKVTDGAANVLDLIGLVNTCQTYSGPKTAPTCDGSNRTPRISVGEVLADGSFKSILKNSSGGVATSETMAVARLAETAVGSGIYRYTLQYGLLEALDPAKSYRVVAYGGRFFKAPGQTAVAFYNSDYYDVVGTNGLAAKETVTDAACNACHGALTLHGMRRGVAICLTCHNPNQALGTGNTDAFKWDLKVLAHKLHSGKNFDGVKPDGTTSTPWGTTMDASHMMMGPSHSTYMDGGNDPGIMGAECGVCHQGANANYAYSKPSRNACGSCHDEVNFATGAGHIVGGNPFPQTADGACNACHGESTMAKIHSPFYDSANNIDFTALANFPAGGHVLDVKITDVQVDAAGLPTITIDAKYKNGAGAMVPAPLDTWLAATDADGATRLTTCAFTIAGPTTDYVLPLTGGTTFGCANNATSTGLVPTATPGVFTVAQEGAGFFQTAAGPPATFRTGAYTVSFEIMMVRVAAKAVGFVRKPFSADPNFFTVANKGTAEAPIWASFERGSGSADDLALSRRAVVTYDKCNACHVDLGFHSNRGRQGPDYCATCHNPKLDNGTRARVPVAAAYQTTATGTALVYLPESVSMNVFIHRIHMGSELPSVQEPANASPWVPEPGKIIYGATRSAFVGVDAATPPEMADLTHFAQPNPMGRCNQCHIESTWALPAGPGLAPVERTFRACTPASPAPSWATEDWCNNTSTSGMPKFDADPVTAGIQALTVSTPPQKAVCTSCHDSLATDVHADLFTTNPMTAGAVEYCGGCHGVGKAFDAVSAHRPIP